MDTVDHRLSSPPRTNNKNPLSAQIQDSPSSTITVSSTSSSGSGRGSTRIDEIPPIASPTQDDMDTDSSRFMLPPSSPTNEPTVYPPGTDPPKVIPMDDENWD